MDLRWRSLGVLVAITGGLAWSCWRRVALAIEPVVGAVLAVRRHPRLAYLAARFSPDLAPRSPGRALRERGPPSGAVTRPSVDREPPAE